MTINAFLVSLLLLLMLYPFGELSAQCRYVSGTAHTETRPQTLAKVGYLSEKLAVQIRKSNDTHYLDVHFETKEAAFGIHKKSAFTLSLDTGETIILQAHEMLHSDAYHTCCDKVWLAEVAYFIPEKYIPSLTTHKVVEINIELDNRQKTYILKEKKQDKIADLLSCIQ